MKRFYISNTEVLKDYSIITNGAFEIGNFFVPDFTGNTVYVIDVHCRFTKGNKEFFLQHQGGLVVYRHLLKQFEGRQDKLKVVFYSPLAAKYLVAIKPENNVLTLLPFVELLKEKDDDGNIIDDWKFESSLTKEIDKFI